MKYDIIKVCGMRDAENIREVAELGVNLIGLDFDKSSARYVSSISSHAGLIPDCADSNIVNSRLADCKLVGEFVNDMIQNIVTAVYNYNLDYVQLVGDEEDIYIDNLRATLEPDIRRGVKIIKSVSISSEEDIQKASQYEGHADLLLFDIRPNETGESREKSDWSILEKYTGTLPFILGGSIGVDDAEELKQFSHPMCVGINLDTAFETAPAIKDVEKLSRFIDEIKAE